MENLSIKDLKALAYDKIAQIENYGLLIEKVKQELNEINKKIQEELGKMSSGA